MKIHTFIKLKKNQKCWISSCELISSFNRKHSKFIDIYKQIVYYWAHATILGVQGRCMHTRSLALVYLCIILSNKSISFDAQTSLQFVCAVVIGYKEQLSAIIHPSSGNAVWECCCREVKADHFSSFPVGLGTTCMGKILCCPASLSLYTLCDKTAASGNKIKKIQQSEENYPAWNALAPVLIAALMTALMSCRNKTIDAPEKSSPQLKRFRKKTSFWCYCPYLCSGPASHWK